jgi:uncharacterized protein YegL
MVLFFIIDTSGSMDGSKINTVNKAVREIIPKIRDISNGYADAGIKIAALEFSSNARWVTPNGPVDPNKYNWTNLDAAGVTDLGEACRMLNEKLSKDAFMAEPGGNFAPVLFLLSDGEPTDNWQKELEQLKRNGWFRDAVKVALAIGGDFDKEALIAFTGSTESVYDVYNPVMLMKMFEAVCISYSNIYNWRPEDLEKLHKLQASDPTPEGDGWSSDEDDSVYNAAVVNRNRTSPIDDADW